MKFLVTGANGFIGRNLIEKLRDENLEIIGIVKNRNNISNLKSRPYTTCVEIL